MSHSARGDKGLSGDRFEYGTVPPKVEYSLTQSGRDLLPTLNELYKWGAAHMAR